jgi:uncharacterized protein (AIM24 family)
MRLCRRYFVLTIICVFLFSCGSQFTEDAIRDMAKAAAKDIAVEQTKAIQTRLESNKEEIKEIIETSKEDFKNLNSEHATNYSQLKEENADLSEKSNRAAQRARKHAVDAQNSAKKANDEAAAASKKAESAMAELERVNKYYKELVANDTAFVKRISEIQSANSYWLQVGVIGLSILAVLRFFAFIYPYVIQFIFAWCLKWRQPKIRIDCDALESFTSTGDDFVCKQRLQIQLDERKRIYVRHGCISKFSANSRPAPTIRTGLRGRWFTRYRHGLLLLDDLSDGTVEIESGYPFHTITSVALEKNQRIFVQLDSIVAFTQGVKLDRYLRFRWSNFLLGKYAFWYLEGPGDMFLRGYGDIKAEYLNGEKNVSFNPDAVLAWAGALETTLNTSRNPFATLIAPNDEIVVQSFAGHGMVLYQMLGKKYIPAVNERYRPLAGLLKWAIESFIR